MRAALGLLMAVWMVVAAPPPAAAGSERVARVEIAREDGRLFVSALLDPSLNAQTEADIRNGISKDLYYYLVLKLRQRNWFDEEQSAVTIKYGIKYNLLKQEYTVTTRTPSGSTHTVLPDFDSVRRMVSRIERIPFVTFHQLQRRRTYVISVKAEMRAPKLPLYLDYFLFFIPFLEIDTPWADSPTFRAPDAG